MRLEPSPRQELLLRAALRPAADALPAWARWKRLVVVEELDRESVCLLPLLHHNLRACGVDGDPALVRYRSVMKHAWTKNRLRFRALAGLLGPFTAAGIPTMALKGVVLALRDYPQVGLRPMQDFDLLVPTADAPRAVELLRARGFAPVPLPTGRTLSGGGLAVYHSWGFRAPDGSEVDLHWHACADACGARDDDDFWAAAVPFTVDGAATRAPGASDLLFQVLAHAYASHAPVIRWIPDVAMILRAEGDAVSWERVAGHAARTGLVLPLRAAVAYLGRSGLVAVPAEAGRRLAAQSVRWLERAERHHRESPAPYSWSNKAQRLFFWSWRRAGRPRLPGALRELPSFLRDYYG